MKKHVSYDKLSKKKQLKIDKEKRGTWFGINPVTRKPESSRAYNRRKAQDWKKDSGPALFYAHEGRDSSIVSYDFDRC